MKVDESLKLGGYNALPRFEMTACLLCRHFKGVEKGTCEAYPNGIPDKFAIRNGRGAMTLHLEVEDDQVGTTTMRS